MSKRPNIVANHCNRMDYASSSSRCQQKGPFVAGLGLDHGETTPSKPSRFCFAVGSLSRRFLHEAEYTHTEDKRKPCECLVDDVPSMLLRIPLTLAGQVAHHVVDLALAHASISYLLISR